MSEIWKDIKEYEGIYLISNYGNVKSLHRNKDNIFKKLTLFKNSYYKVNLWHNNNQQTFYVHQLVAKSFIDNPNNRIDVNHIDGNKLNNHVNNLEWVTSLENTTHAITNNLMNNTGELNGSVKLTELQVLEIDKLLHTTNMSNVKIANKFNVSSTTISFIKNRKKWKYLFNNV